MLREAITVGIVLKAQDLYSGMLQKAERNLDILRRKNSAMADDFQKRLNNAKMLGAAGIAITGFGAAVAPVFEDIIRTAGAMQTAVDRAFIQMGDTAGVSREQLEKWFRSQKLQWGMTDDEISAALISAGGKLGDYRQGLDLVATSSRLATARNIELGQATDLVQRLYALYGNHMAATGTAQEKFTGISSELNQTIKDLGGNTETLDTYLQTVGIRAAGAGQPLEDVLAILSTLGASGAGGRMSMALTTVFDKMAEWRRTGGGAFRVMYPGLENTGSLISFLDDLKNRFAHLHTSSREQVEMLTDTRAFGAAGTVVKMLLDNLDLIKTKQANYNAAVKDSVPVTKDADREMSTWEGTQKKLNAQLGVLKEALGVRAIPMTEKFLGFVGKLTEKLGEGGLVGGIAGTAFALTGFAGEISRVVGPVMTVVGAFGLWRTNALLAAAATLDAGASTGAAPALGAIAKGMGLSGAVTETAAGGAGGLTFGTLTATIGTATLAIAAGVLTGAVAGGWVNDQITSARVADAIATLKRGATLTGTGQELSWSDRWKIALAYARRPDAFSDPLIQGLLMSEVGKDLISQAQRAGAEGKPPLPSEKPLDLRGKIHLPGLSAPGDTLSATKPKPEKSRRHATYVIPGLDPEEVTRMTRKWKPFALGGPVLSTGLALLHQGEYVLNRRETAAQSATTYVGPITINLPAFQPTGKLDYDARALARHLLPALSSELKAQSRRTARLAPAQ